MVKFHQTQAVKGFQGKLDFYIQFLNFYYTNFLIKTKGKIFFRYLKKVIMLMLFIYKYLQ